MPGFATGHDCRRALRSAIEISVSITDADGQSQEAGVTDISVHGCSIWIASGPGLIAGHLISIALPDLEARPAEVVWSRDRRSGLMFLDPLPRQTVKHLAQKWLCDRLSRNSPDRSRPLDNYLPNLPRFREF
jgi:hypothetical protein